MQSDPDYQYRFTDYVKETTIFDYLYDSTAIFLWARDTLKKGELVKVDYHGDVKFMQHPTPILNMKKVIGMGKDGKPIYGDWFELPGEFERITTIYRRKYDDYGTPNFSWK